MVLSGAPTSSAAALRVLRILLLAARDAGRSLLSEHLEPFAPGDAHADDSHVISSGAAIDVVPTSSAGIDLQVRDWSSGWVPCARPRGPRRCRPCRPCSRHDPIAGPRRRALVLTIPLLRAFRTSRATSATLVEWPRRTRRYVVARPKTTQHVVGSTSLGCAANVGEREGEQSKFHREVARSGQALTRPFRVPLDPGRQIAR